MICKSFRSSSGQVLKHHLSRFSAAASKNKMAENLENASPSSLRLKFRQGDFQNSSTSGMCGNFVHTNIAIVAAEYAKDFREFADVNSAPCPLLYESKVGEYEAPVLAEGSDIRTDLISYKVSRNGKKQIDEYDEVTQFNWESMVTFYFGCSFTFEQKLLSAEIPVRNIAQNRNVSMYSSNIECVSVGPFACKMVVSMRPIPRGLLDATVAAVIQMDYAHGAPIHIGNPSQIGIEDVNAASAVIGDLVDFEEGDVPVFWACGVTSSHAVSSANIPLAITHSPGKMFLSDRTVEEIQSITNSTIYPEAKVVCINEHNQTYSLISQKAWQRITAIEELILNDPGNRGVKHLSKPNDLHHAALSLSQSSKSVAIITGFPCLMDCDPPIENDGISGSISIARAMQSLGKQVTFIIDRQFADIFRTILAHCHQNGLLKQKVSVLTLTGSSQDIVIDEATGKARFSHLISIERPGRATSGKYCTMNNRDITKLCDPIDELFLEAEKHFDITTIGIGDGGNEIGMGKVFDKIVENVKHGSEIATVIAADYLITAGVSNWAGYALAKAIFLCVTCPVHERYVRKGIGRTRSYSENEFVAMVEKEGNLLEYQMSIGIRDGVTAKLQQSVDGLDFFPHHSSMIEKIQNL